MSQSIDIPRRSTRARRSIYGDSSSNASSSSAVASSSSDSPSSSYSASRFASPKTPGSTMSPPSASSSLSSSSPAQSAKSRLTDRRPSLLGSSLSHSEYTVINIAGPDRPPRLVSCVKSSQGFDWNQDIFLPSYIDYDSSELECKADPVEDIILTDEEAAALLPQ